MRGVIGFGRKRVRYMGDGWVRGSVVPKATVEEFVAWLESEDFRAGESLRDDAWRPAEMR